MNLAALRGGVWGHGVWGQVPVKLCHGVGVHFHQSTRQGDACKTGPANPLTSPGEDPHDGLGAVTVQSEPGHETTFTICLPRLEESPAPSVEAPAAPAPPPVKARLPPRQ